MAERNWFSRKFAWWLVPINAQTLDRRQWSLFLWLSGFGKSRSQRSRRRRVILVNAWLVILAAAFSVPVLDPAHRNPAALIAVLVPLSCSIAMRQYLRFSARMSLEDRAPLQYGADFHLLTEMQRRDLLLDQLHDQGGMRQDEREADLRRRAQATTYRILLPVAISGVIGYGIACQLHPSAERWETLAIAAVVGAVWLASAAVILPATIRLWAQPDNPLCPKLVEPAQKEA